IRFDEPLEEGAVRGLAIAGQGLQLRDGGIGDPALADEALRSRRQGAQLAVDERRVERRTELRRRVAERLRARPEPDAGGVPLLRILLADAPPSPAPRPD